MREKGFGECLTEFVVDGCRAWWHAIATAVASECTEEGAVGRAGVPPVEAVDDMKSVLEWFECLDRLRQDGLRQRPAIAHARRDAGLGVKALVLHEEDDPLGSA